MNHYTLQDTRDEERQAILAAIERLLTGTAITSNGQHTVVALAKEAGLSRPTLYDRHPDLIAEFRTRAGLTPATPQAQRLQAQLEDAIERNKELEEENQHLTAKIRTLVAIVAEMSIEADPDNNVVRLPRR